MTKQKRKAKTAKIGKTNLKHIYSLPLTRAPQLLLEYRAVVLVYFNLVAVRVIHSQMEEIKNCGCHEFFIICIFFLMSA